MAQWHGISRRKPSGGRKVQARQASHRNLHREAIRSWASPSADLPQDRWEHHGRVAANQVSINNPKTGKTTLGTIRGVVENASDPSFVRRNILVKGAWWGRQGRVRITPDPADGVINAFARMTASDGGKHVDTVPVSETMDHNPDRLCVWPGYFDMKRSACWPPGSRFVRSQARLGGPVQCGTGRWPAQDQRGTHLAPSSPHGREGRLWVSSSGTKESIRAGSRKSCSTHRWSVAGNAAQSASGRRSGNGGPRRATDSALSTQKYTAAKRFQEACFKNL